MGSASCEYTNEKLNKTVSKVAMCNAILNQIKNNYAESGYLKKLDSCVNDALVELNNFLRPDKGPILKLLHMMTHHNHYSQAEKIEKDLKNIPAALIPQDNSDLLQQHQHRLELKRSNFEQRIIPIHTKFLQVKADFPKWWRLKNIVYKENYKYTPIKEFEVQLGNSLTLANQMRINTALNTIPELNETLTQIQQHVSHESKKERNLHFKAIILLVTVLIVLAILTFKFIIWATSDPRHRW